MIKINIIPKIFHLPKVPSLAPGGERIRDPGNEGHGASKEPKNQISFDTPRS